jgi:hypothetical protein
MTMFGSQWLANAGGGYTIDQSIRFNKADDATLTRTFGTATNRKIYTLSVWEKNGNSAGSLLEYNATPGVTWANITFGQNGRVDFFDYSGGAARIDLRTSAIYRDPSAWYHVVVAVDTTQATSTDRIKMYVNGVQITSFGTATYPSQNFDGFINSAVSHLIGDGVNGPFDGYLAEYHFVDGQALAPTDFGEYNDAGVWIPIEASPTYGTNGFYITGETASDLGEDFSGNGNDFTSSGLATADQMLDTPTDNYSIFNPVASCNVSGQPLTISDGNLRTSAGGTLNSIEAITQIGPSSGKYYAEFTLNAAPQLSNQYPVIGVIAADLDITGGNNVGNSTFRGYVPNGNTQGTGSGAYGDTFTTNDVIGCAIDLDNQKIWWSKNGTFQNSGDPAAGTNAAFTNLTAGLFYRFCISHAGSTATDVTGNFGQTGGFTYTPPTGFNALSTANLATPSIKDGSAHFQPTLYTGTGSSQAVSQSGNSTFQPDWVWIKGRSGATEHVLTDAVRGVTKELSSNDTGAEETVAQGLTTFGSAGFTVGTDGSYNTSSATYVGWQWKANGAGSSNTDGSITSTVSADTTSGFSIIRWSGTGANGTIGHGLGIQPSLYIVKNTATTNSWMVGSTLYDNTKFLILNATDALDTAAAVWNSAYPTSSVVNLGSNVASNGSGTNNMICYAFAEIPGYSSIGSYTGNGSADGPMIFTSGMKPAWLTVKRAVGGTGNWDMFDIKRDPINPADAVLDADSSGAEASYATIDFDFLSNGFKVRGTQSNINASGSTYIYIAFAENPFGGDGVAPATAR